jgi:hypothetical protein
VSQEPKRVRIPSGDTFERKRLEALGYFIESGDGQYLVMRLDYPAGILASEGPTQIPRKPAA